VKTESIGALMSIDFLTVVNDWIFSKSAFKAFVISPKESCHYIGQVAV
jgi:hypothetical protein